ncbi:Erythronolide synthase [Durusdinium trenchii]|uniref:Modules 5 and 6 n=1 Tax=Durusdinium trenchii TaxID=1381693 RepID=A0ABP0RND8_9DINO
MSAYQSAGDRLGEASVLACMVQIKTKKEDFYAASQAANEQRAIFQQLGDRSREATCLLTAAGCLTNDNNLDQALQLADEAYDICREIEEPAGEAQALMAQAEIISQREDMETAVEKAKEMRRRGKDINYRPRASCEALANVYQSFERLVESVRAANEAVQLAKKATYKPIIVEMMLLAVKVNSSLVLQDGAQVGLCRSAIVEMS